MFGLKCLIYLAMSGAFSHVENEILADNGVGDGRLFKRMETGLEGKGMNMF